MPEVNPFDQPSSTATASLDTSTVDVGPDCVRLEAQVSANEAENSPRSDAVGHFDVEDHTENHCGEVTPLEDYESDGVASTTSSVAQEGKRRVRFASSDVNTTEATDTLDHSSSHGMWMNDADSIDLRVHESPLPRYLPSVDAPIVEAHEVEDERAEFIRHVRQSILAEAETVHVQVVDAEAPPRIGTETESTEPPKDHDDTTATKRMLLLFIVVMLVVFGSTPLWISDRKSSAHSATDASFEGTTPAPTPAIVYLSDGRQAFTSTRQLYDAVDAFVKASETNETKSSDVAIQYGYPIGTWDVSRLSDFSRVFNLDRDRPLDTSNRLARHSTMNEDLSGWNVSRAVTMYGMFAGASKFVGQGLEHWDTSRVTDFSFMFFEAKAFVGNLSTWDTSRATQMMAMFMRVDTFDGNLTWNVANVDSMAFMFKRARLYRGHGVANWNVANVRNMESMFDSALAFTGNVSTWNTSRVENMAAMFLSAKSFNADLSFWQVERVQNMAEMFRLAERFQGIGLSKWSTVRVISITAMFAHCEVFEEDLSQWDVSRVSTLSHAFNNAIKFDANLSGWNTSSAVAMQQMFFESTAFSADLALWDTSKVTTMYQMFVRAVSFNSNLSNWQVTRAADVEGMFIEATSFNYSLCSWGQRLPSSGLLVKGMFAGASSCETTSDPSTVNVSNGPFCHYCDADER